MLDEVRALRSAPTAHTSAEFPMVLSAGERRAYTANDILRDPTWRKRDADGALRVSVEDAGAIGLLDGGRARITTAAGSAVATVEVSDAMLPGHVSLPNGYGLDYVDGDGRSSTPGRGAERVDVDGVARRLCGHPVAQARAGTHRGDSRVSGRPGGQSSSRAVARRSTWARLRLPWSAATKWLPMASEKASSARASTSSGSAQNVPMSSRR